LLKEDILKNISNQTVDDTYKLGMSMATVWLPTFFKNIFFRV